MILGIHACVGSISLALVKNEEHYAGLTLSSSHSHTENLINHIKKMMEYEEVSWSDISGVGVTVGPGSYTGCRLGVTTAKTIAQSLSCPAIGVSSLEIIARQWQGSPMTIISMIPARKNECNVAIFDLIHSSFQQLTPNFTWKHDTAISKLKKIKGNMYIAGIIPEEIAKKVKPLSSITLLPTHPSATTVAIHAEKSIKNGDASHWKNIQPIYSFNP